MAGYQPHQGQIAFHKDTHRIRCLVAGTRFGKTKACAMEAIAAMMYLPGSRGWIVAPNYDLAKKIYREVVEVMNSPQFLPYVKRQNDYHMTVILNNKSELVGKSCVVPESLLGETLDYAILDEAARMDEEIWTRYISRRLDTKLGWAALITTPYGKNWVYETFLKGQNPNDKYVKSWRFPSEVSPYVPKEAIEYHKLNDPERIYRQECLAEFIESGGEVFHGLNELVDSRIKLTQDPTPGVSYIIGVDFAKQIDFTVITILNQRGHLVYVERFQQVDYDRQLNRIVYLAQHFNNASVWIDATGQGDPLYDFFYKENIKVFPFKLSNKSKDSLVKSLEIAIDKRLIHVPPWDCSLNTEILKRELEMFQYDKTPAGAIIYKAPQGQHDDCVISLALSVWGLQSTPMRELPPEMWRMTPVGVDKPDMSENALARIIRARREDY